VSSTEFVNPPPEIIPGYTTDWNIYSLVVQAKKQVTDGSKQAESYKEEVEYSVTHVSQ
jgi:hypothetical protein